MCKSYFEKKLIFVLSVILSMVFFSGCTAETAEEDNTLSIVTVGFAEYDFARAVCGDLAEVSMIMKPGGEYHGYEPSFSDIKKISDSDVFIYIGGESDTWVRSLLGSGDYGKSLTVSLVENVQLLKSDLHGHAHSHSHHGHDEECTQYAEYDEHIWLDFDNAISMIERICEAMCESDSKNQNAYRSNAKEYSKKITELKSYALTIKENKTRDTIAVGDKFPYLYLTEYLGIEYLSAIAGCGHESDASPSDIIEIIDKIQKDSIPIVFCDEMSDTSIARAIKKETGAEIRTLHSCQTISKKDFESGKTYVDIMRKNLEIIKEALM